MTNEEFIRMVVEDNSEVVFLYGHTHSKSPKGYVNGTYHVGADTNDLTPISIEQIWRECWPEEIMTPENTAYKVAHDLNPNLEDQCARRGQRRYCGLYEDYAGGAIAQAAPAEIKLPSIEELVTISKDLEEQFKSYRPTSIEDIINQIINEYK